MNYPLERLIPIVAELANKYTGKQSSSITYERAEILMEAILYCIQECFDKRQDMVIDKGDMPAELLYQKGCEVVLKKFEQAKKTYEKLIEDFEDFGCRNYRDTIREGMPRFFQNYDIHFEPQNHLLMLDYPCLVQSDNLKGVDLILEYLQNIEKENQFLLQFDSSTVIALMERAIIDYQELYLDNICSLVLLTALGSMIADKSVYSLQLASEDEKLITDFFKGDNCDKIEEKLKALIHILSDKLSCKKLEKYLTSTCRDFAVRIYNAQRNQTICVLFGIQGIVEADDIGIDEIIL